jgi:hypothetical protein
MVDIGRFRGNVVAVRVVDSVSAGTSRLFAWWTAFPRERRDRGLPRTGRFPLDRLLGKFSELCKIHVFRRHVNYVIGQP